MHPVRIMGLLLLPVALGLSACGSGRRLAVVEEAVTGAADEKHSDAGLVHLGDLKAEVTALQVLHALDVSPAQLDQLAKLAAQTMQKPPPRRLVKASEKYRKALRGLRDALAGSDDKKLEAASTAMDEAAAKESPDVDVIEITAAARQHAAALLRRFSARQVVGYLSGLEEILDPVELLEGGMEQSRQLRGRAWQDERDAVAFEVGWLVGGLDEAAEKKARAAAAALLNRAAALDDMAFAEKRAALREEARTLVDPLGPTDVLRHYMQRVLAETLSNHRLAAAVAALRKRG